MNKSWLGRIWDWFVEEGMEASSAFSVMGLCASNHILQKRLERSMKELEKYNDPTYSGTSSDSRICEAAKEYSMRIGDGIQYVSYMTFWGVLYILLRALAMLFGIFVCVTLLSFLLRS